MVIIFLQILLIVFLLCILGILILNLLVLPFYVYAMIRGAFYAPTSSGKVQIMLNLVKEKKIRYMADIGSGDGRIVIAFAKAGILADGFEINPMLVLRSQLKMFFAFSKSNSQFKKNVKIYLKDFWFQDFKKYDLVTLYGITRIMPKLEEKLQKELRPGSLVISNAFQFPAWKVMKKVDGVIVYQKQ